MNQEVKPTIRSFTDLDTWKEGHRLVIMVYKNSEHFPENEQFGLVSQLRRAVVSITSNIAEGFSRGSYKDKIRFYEIALGSTTEVQNQLLIARDMGYIEALDFKKLANQSVTVHKLINGLIKYSRRTVRST